MNRFVCITDELQTGDAYAVPCYKSYKIIAVKIWSNVGYAAIVLFFPTLEGDSIYGNSRQTANVYFPSNSGDGGLDVYCIIRLDTEEPYTLSLVKTVIGSSSMTVKGFKVFGIK